MGREPSVIEESVYALILFHVTESLTLFFPQKVLERCEEDGKYVDVNDNFRDRSRKNHGGESPDVLFVYLSVVLMHDLHDDCGASVDDKE